MSALLKEEIIQDNSLFSFEEIKEGMFCDYISIYQDHDDLMGTFPVFNGGKIINLDQNGVYTEENISGVDTSDLFNRGKVVEFDGEKYKQLWESVKKMQVKGSHNTSIMVFSDGKRVLVMGNAGRFGRIDNVFNLSFWETVYKINDMLKRFGLPPFTKGKSSYFDGKSTRHCGAVVTRIDMTINIRTGSQTNANHTLNMLKSRSMKYVSTKIYDNGVGFGTGRNACKAYNKAQEIFNHLKGKKKEYKEEVLSSLGYLTAYNEGFVRFEEGIDRKTLSETRLRDIENITDEKLAMALKNKVDEVFFRTDKTINKYDPMLIFDKKKHQRTIDAWMLGRDLRDPLVMSQPTFSRHRREILAISGIDISMPFISIEESFGTAQLYQEIELSIAKPPEDYEVNVDLNDVMPDLDNTLPVNEWKQLAASEGVIDFQKYKEQQEKKVNEIPKYFSLSNGGFSTVIQPSPMTHEQKRDLRLREEKYKQAKSKADKQRAYEMSKLYQIHKENKRVHR